MTVSIHAPAQGATRRYIRCSGRNMFQSTRPHRARRLRGEHQPWGSMVSIHAPAQGATTAGGTSTLGINGFNPRARTGRDGKVVNINSALPVSIHAPAQGATSVPESFTHTVKFQSTRPHRARRGSPQSGRNVISFNPRARTGRDWERYYLRLGLTCFNPRARTGRDVSISILAEI